MKQNFPGNHQIKQLAKQMMGATLPRWIKVTALFVCLQVGLWMLSSLLGGTIIWQMVALSDYPAAATGFFPTDLGFSLILRAEPMGVVMALSMTYQQVKMFLLVNLVVFLLLAPMRYAALEQFWGVVNRKEPPFPRWFRWYYEIRLVWKSILLEAALSLFAWAVRLVSLLPGLILYYFLLTSKLLDPGTSMSLAGISLLLMLAGACLSYYVGVLLLPVRYCLVAHPEYSFAQIIQKGLRATKGFRGAYFWLHFSFIPWAILSQVTYGAMNFYVFPYISFSVLTFLSEAAKQRQTASGDLIQGNA